MDMRKLGKNKWMTTMAVVLCAALRSTRQKSTKASCLTLSKNLLTLVIAYAQKSSVFFPSIYFSSTSSSSKTHSQ